MNIDFDSLKLNSNVKNAQINNRIQMLIENDRNLSRSAAAPTIWECKWYNISPEYAYEYGYSKGSGVWLNTQNIDDFIQARADDIYYYASKYDKTSKEVQNLTSDYSALTSYYKTLINGNNSFDNYHKYMFYLGDISAQTQIRISKIDGNIYPPNNDEYWEDYIDREDKTDIVYSMILSALEEKLKTNLETHLKQYHLSGIVGYNKKYTENTQFTDMFLNEDMSNSGNGGKFTSHQYTTHLSGFDYVVNYQNIVDDMGNVKWFRKWYSGLLEHGGIISVGYGDKIFENDTLEYDYNCYQVNLNWTYGSSTAEVYNYPVDSSQSFYGRDENLDFGYNNKIEYEVQSNSVWHKYRYQISITPLGNDDVDNPYYYDDSLTTPHYTLKEVLNMTNTSFRFKLSEYYSKYSYYVRGFVKNG